MYSKSWQTSKEKQIHSYTMRFQLSINERINRKSNITFLLRPTLTINLNCAPSFPTPLSCTCHLLTNCVFVYFLIFKFICIIQEQCLALKRFFKQQQKELLNKSMIERLLVAIIVTNHVTLHGVFLFCYFNEQTPTKINSGVPEFQNTRAEIIDIQNGHVRCIGC